MRQFLIAQSHRRALLLTALICLLPTLSLANEFSPASIIFSEDFEDSWGWWYADNGTWGVGTPTSGPMAAFEGAACAGTNLDGPYSQHADSRLISPPIGLPNTPEGGGLWVSLENWFALGADDMVTIEISDDNTATWHDLGPVFQNASECWTHLRTAIDVSEYAGATVQFALHIIDDGSNTTNPAGFYLDLFTIYDGPPPAMTVPADFESGHSSWFADNGSWQIGQPTVGPMSGHASDNCAGTNLDGPYARYADSRLVSPVVELDTPSGGNALYLTFQHWGSISNGDAAVVEISTNGFDWTSVTGVLANTNEEWQTAYVDISAYAGETVSIGFAIRDDGGSGTNNDGWFVDDVEFYEGPPRTWPAVEGFEDGLTGWTVEGGVWEIGTPTSGPESAFSGTSCAATNLAGNYPRYANARLISPPTSLPNSPEDDSLQLSFWQWFHHEDWGDYLDVEIRGDDNEWVSLYQVVSLRGRDWTRNLVDISAYAGQTIQIAFRLNDDDNGGEFTGWYLDDLSLIEGLPEAWTHEDFEGGIGGWSADSGIWEVGTPTHGPDGAFEGMNCAGTNLDGNYEYYSNTRLISPPTALPNGPADGSLQLSFWQWFHHEDWGDYLDLEIKGDDGEWVSLYRVVSLRGRDWTRNIVDISAYAGQTVQFAFHLNDDDDGAEFAGWFIDEIDIIEGLPDSWTEVNFENGIGDWSTDNGIWEVGTPTYGPTDMCEGNLCAGTNLDGNYETYSDTRLISPPTTLTDSPEDGSLRLSFCQWFDHRDWGDILNVDIRGDSGEWETIHTITSLLGNTWTTIYLDISAYAGQQIQLGFHLYEDRDGAVFAGWYIDDIKIEEGLPIDWTHTGFENGIAGWSADNGIWQIGTPTYGPDGAYLGDNCAATNLDGNYPTYASTRLISPPTTLSASPENGLIQLSFWQWFHHEDWGDHLYVDIKGDDGEWVMLRQVVSLRGRDWTRDLVDISAFAGQTVQIAFRLYEDNDGAVFAGWYVDEVEIIEGLIDGWVADDFEAGLGGWSTDGGVWQVGTPLAGPDQAHHGTRCAGTNLDGNYECYMISRLVSPALVLDLPSDDGTYWLSYWHWFNRHIEGDVLEVQIRTLGEDWQPLHRLVSRYNPIWTRSLLDISAFAGQTIQVAFLLDDDNSGSQSHGWFIDDVEFIGGAPAFVAPDNFENADWAQLPDLGGWSADHGCWEFGSPSFNNGPEAAFEGDFCAGTFLAGNYPILSDSRLISPPINLDPTPLEGQLWFTFQHWYSLYNNDTGTLEILLPDSSWAPIAEPFVHTSGDWTMRVIDVSEFAGQTVQFGFHLHDNPSSSSHVAAGWYIDKVSLVNGPMLFNNPEGFETRTKGWYADAGVWQIGEPMVGPDTPHAGAWSAGTILDGNYPRYTDSRLISPTMIIPSAAMARFYQWFDLATNDSALFEISIDGGEWEQLGGFTTTSNWTPYVSNLSAYVGQEVRFAFHLKDYNDGVQDMGWYVDSFEVFNMPTDIPEAPVFQDVTYSADVPVLSWDITAAGHAYMAVYAGHFDAYEPDFGNRIALTTDNPFLDVDHPGWRSGYFISSINALWQESDLAAPGNVIGVDEPTPSYPMALNQNYPNPFNPMTVVSFTLASETDVKIEIFDVAGRKVLTLLEDRLEAGKHEVHFDGRQHASGVYFCRFQTEGFTETRKMALLK